MEGKNVGTIRGEIPKQGLTNATDLTIEIPRYLVKITNETNTNIKEHQLGNAFPHDKLYGNINYTNFEHS